MIHCLERNGPITEYLVSYGESQDELMNLKEEKVTGLSFIAVGLQPLASYRFRVRGLMSNITEPTHTISPSATFVTTTSVPQGKDA